MSETKNPLLPHQENLWSELAGLFSMLASTIWLTAWHSALFNTGFSWGGLILVFFLTLSVTHYLSRFINLTGDIRSVHRFLFLGWTIFVILLSLKLVFFMGNPLNVFQMIKRVIMAFGFEQGGTHQFFHILLMLYLIWRGVNLSKRPNSLGDNIESFQVGFLIFLIYGLAFGWRDPQNSLPAVSGFLFISLIGMSLGKIASLGTIRGGRVPRVSFARILAVLFVSFCVTALAVLVGWLLKDRVAMGFASIVISILSLALLVFWSIASPVLFFIIEMAFRVGEYIFSRIPNLNPQNDILNYSEQFRGLNDQNQNLLQESIKNYDRMLMIGMIIVIVIILLMILRIKPWRLILGGVEEEGERIEGTRAKKQGGAPDFSRLTGTFKNFRRYLSEARIRRVYAQFMAFCARLDHPRPPAMTPLEFIPLAQTLFSSNPAAVQIITLAYTNVRYGEAPESDEEIDRVLSAWEEIKKEGKHLLSERKRFPSG